MPEVLVPIAFFGMIATIAVGRPLAKALAARLDPGSASGRRRFLAGSPEPATEARLSVVEERLSLLSTELERSREEQRFLTDLLADRGSLPTGGKR